MIVCILYFATLTASDPGRVECQEVQPTPEVLSTIVQTCVTTHEGATVDCLTPKPSKRRVIIRWYYNWYQTA